MPDNVSDASKSAARRDPTVFDLHQTHARFNGLRDPTLSAHSSGRSFPLSNPIAILLTRVALHGGPFFFAAGGPSGGSVGGNFAKVPDSGTQQSQQTRGFGLRRTQTPSLFLAGTSADEMAGPPLSL